MLEGTGFMALSPMMQQYMDIKDKHRDCILFFRLGDFYEMFFEDAVLASRELELTLTGKNCGQEERAPMCGVPFHSAENYIAKLVSKGYKVAICEQTEDPAMAKGLVKRDVIQIVTPGTVTSQSMLKENENNYICSVFANDNNMGIAYCDISTGELNVTEFREENSQEILVNELVKIKAKEVLINKSYADQYSMEEIELNIDAFFNCLDENYYKEDTITDTILRHFNVKSMKGLGISDIKCGQTALGALLIYLFEMQKQSLCHIKNINFYEIGKHMSLDKATIRNLEITETLYDKKIQGSLLGVLDKTHTAMGSRKMKKWLREPLNKASEINERLDAVEVMSDDFLMRNNTKEALKKIYDLERLAGRIACGNANGKDLIALRNSLYVLPEIKQDLFNSSSTLLRNINKDINPLESVCELISNSISEEPPFTIKEGGIIKDSFSEELDHLKSSIKDSQSWIAALEGKERERTGIKNLKVGFNKIFGYYLEITKSYFDLIPENYIRKQTLVNCERFITPELKETESLVLNAEAKINKLEYDIFVNVREKIQDFIGEIQVTSSAISALDVIISFAEVSSELSYVKPVVTEEKELFIEKGRHPVIEQTIKNGLFVSNNIYINDSDSSMLLITGPNMAGKSTYMRQTALIVLMAQAGCFVPCEYAKIGVVDRIFTRIGASDNLAQGQSTFFVEMSELAYILNASTDRSLIILDEIGRGTSTYDGLSIAWAVVEHLCNSTKHIRTLFATHYHELTSLEGKLTGFKNFNVGVVEENGNIVFLHKIVEGSASRSYGIHVAKLAGVPYSVIERAKDKLQELEENKELSVVTKESNAKENEQISFFSFAPNKVVERLKALDLMEIKPSEAFKILEELKDAADD